MLSNIFLKMMQGPTKVYVFILIGISIIILLPSLWLPWSLIDDGVNILNGKSIHMNLISGNWRTIWQIMVVPTPDYGRFAPTHLLFEWAQYFIFGLHPAYYHLFHLILIALVTGLLFAIVYHLTKNKLSAFFTGLFFVVFLPTVKNYYRLGPTEPQLILYELVSIAFLILALKTELKTKRSLYFSASIFSLFFAYLAKETTVILLPISLVTYLLHIFPKSKRVSSLSNNITLKFLIANVVFTVSVFLIRQFLGTSASAGAYARKYFSDIPSFINNVQATILAYPNVVLRNNGYVFLVLPAIVLILFIIRYKRYKKTDNLDVGVIRWQLIFLVWFIFQVAILLPWRQVEDRYLLPAMLGLAPFLGIEIGHWIGYIVKQSMLKSTFQSFRLRLIFVIMLFFFVEQGSQIWNFVNEYFIREQTNNRMVHYLSLNAPRSSKIYMNLTGAPVRDQNEWLYETQVHLKFFLKREDLKSDYLVLSENPLYTTKDLIAIWNANRCYSQIDINNYFKDKILLSYIVRNVSTQFDFSLKNISQNLRSITTNAKNYTQTIMTKKLHQWEIYSISN